MGLQGGRGSRRALAVLGGTGRARGRAALAIFVATLAAVVAPTAHAADRLSIDPAIDRGVAQLEGTQLPDGSFGARLPVRDTAAAGEALMLARPWSGALPGIETFLLAQDLGDVDDLARAMVASPS